MPNCIIHKAAESKNCSEEGGFKLSSLSTMDSPSTTDVKSDPVLAHARVSKLAVHDVESETKADLGSD